MFCQVDVCPYPPTINRQMWWWLSVVISCVTGKLRSLREFPVAWILGVPMALGTSVHCGRRLLAAEMRAELEQRLCLASLEQPCQSNHEQQCHHLLLLLAELCLRSKNLVWVEAVGLYFGVWYNFAGEIHGVTCAPKRHVDARSCQHWYSLRRQNACMRPCSGFKTTTRRAEVWVKPWQAWIIFSK